MGALFREFPRDSAFFTAEFNEVMQPGWLAKVADCQRGGSRPLENLEARQAETLLTETVD
jgi:hypothetical protein